MQLRQTFRSGFVVALLVMAACAGKEQGNHNHHADGHHEPGAWKEMDRFHAIMREAFHPYKDSSNLEPAKRRASELMTAADEWADAELPEDVDVAEVKKKLQQLRSEAVTLAESVKSADDNVIGMQLTQLHDTFHQIEETWRGGH